MKIYPSLFLFITAILANGCFQVERDGLLTFKASLIDHGNRMSSWHGRDCCNWSGITCDDITGHVVKLNLSNAYSWYFQNYSDWEYLALSGEITPALLSLRHLTHFDLSYNNFGNLTIPKFISSFENLVHLDLSYSWFYGVIPKEFGNLTQLQFLDLSLCIFTGLVPPQLGNLSDLTHLSLYFSYPFSSNPAIDSLSWLFRLTNLTYLDMSGDNLNNRVNWSEINKMHMLETLSLSSCSLSEIPIDLSHVNLTALTKLDVSLNSFQEKLPNWLWNLTGLLYLDLGSCDFHGRIPKALTNLASLNYLSLGDNNFEHVVLEPISELHNLTSLDMTNLQITGVIPPWFWNMSLKYIDLSYNNITGNLPASFQLSKLRGLKLAYNNISGPIPSIVGRMRVLDLSKNQINGSIPHDICDMTKLLLLDLSNNAISGEIPVCWKNISLLQYIDLSNNHFTGELHGSIGSLQGLTILQLDNNKLYGEIPSSLQYCNNLVLLSLARNNFSGNIPTWIGEQLQNLVVLQLRWNKFSGCIPPELGKLSNLQILDISHNSLVGLIPNSVGNLSSMKESSKSFDSFGDLDEDFYHATLYIDINGPQVYTSTPLDFAKTILISENNLSGPIPEEIWSLQAIINLNLSKNCFTGVIPETVAGMQSLESLDLSFNNLSGLIPQALSSLSTLHNLNLSYNNFSGRIPTGRQLDTISVPSIYAGNPYLCGPQIDKNCSDDQASRSINFAHGNNGMETIWFYLAVTLGFIFGFWSVWAVLIFRNDWKVTYFQMIDRFFDKFMCTLCLLRGGLVGDSASIRMRVRVMFSTSDKLMCRYSFGEQPGN